MEKVQWNKPKAYRKEIFLFRGMAPPNNLTENVKFDESELKDWEPPRAQGLYDPQNEHEACGVGFIVAIDGKRNHKVRRRLMLIRVYSPCQQSQVRLCSKLNVTFVTKLIIYSSTVCRYTCAISRLFSHTRTNDATCNFPVSHFATSP